VLIILLKQFWELFELLLNTKKAENHYKITNEFHEISDQFF